MTASFQSARKHRATTRCQLVVPCAGAARVAPLTEGVVGAKATDIQETDVDLPEELGDEEVPVLRLKVRDDGHPEALNGRRRRGPVVRDRPLRADAVAQIAQKQLRLSLVSRDDRREDTRRTKTFSERKAN